jgi:primosomal protein N' (replication factor Y)
VPLGRSVVTAYIVGLTDQPPENLAEIDIKDAQSLVDTTPVCSTEILQLARWVADYYACPLGEVIKAALPPGMSPKRRGAAFAKPKLRRFVRLRQPTEQKLTESQRRVISTLENSGPMSLQSLLQTASVSASTISSLEKKALVEIYVDAIRRDPLGGAGGVKSAEHTLTVAQSSVLAQIEQQMNAKSYSAFLLHGVTGSGKTEIYMRAIDKALQLGRSAMMLVP